MSELNFIENAFAARARSEQVRDMTRPADEIYADADAFAGMDWREVTCALLDKHFDAVHGFSPAAFCGRETAALSGRLLALDGDVERASADRLAQCLARGALRRRYFRGSTRHRQPMAALLNPRRHPRPSRDDQPREITET